MKSWWQTFARVVLVAGTVPLAACQFSAQASGEAKTGGESKLEGDASFETGQPEATEAEQAAIRYEQGKLDYKGVINFEYNRAEIRTDEETNKTLGEFKQFLEKNKDVKISVEGHTDSRGSDEYNRKLSDRRAASVRAWLLSNGIAEERVTSVGKGEDAPQIPEPAECDDKEPEDTTPCEETWGKNRRVVFTVTEGAETIAQAPEEPAAEPEPAPPPPPAEEEDKCHWLVGPRLGVLGPNSWVNGNVAVQPCLDWLELSLGIGLGLGDAEGESTAADADGSYWSLTVPLRARFWPFRVHSPIADLGIGITHYRISADAEAAGSNYDYTRNSTPIIAHAGLGYGFRPNGPEPGLRLAIMIGALFHLTDLSDPEVDSDAGFASAAELTNSLNDDTDELTDIEPYAELSVGWMF
jgi:outer membrane protein OmpA-like peptidoglycan-associated protein